MDNKIILKKNIDVYDNQVNIGILSGRINVKHEIYPAPAIFWEFESFNSIEQADFYTKPPFISKNLLIKQYSFGKINQESTNLKKTGNIITGSAAKVYVGKRSLKGNLFSFYLPNAKFQELGITGKDFTVKETLYKQGDSKTKFCSKFREGFLETEICNELILTLYTPIEAIEWLESSRSIGTNITTIGSLEIRNNEITIFKAVKLLEDISYLLSFANGGYIEPVIVCMEPKQFSHVKESPIQYCAYAIDAIEIIGSTWLCSESDTSTFLNCLPSFQKMMKSSQWEHNFNLVLTWYFQAIQSQGIQLFGKPWPIVANALGAALEKLSDIILVEEKKIFSRNKYNNFCLETKIRKTLETIGIRNIGPKFNDSVEGPKDAIWWFKEIRNDATHSKSKREWTKEEVDVILGNAIQWIEEILLWRLGYKGNYRDRSKGNQFSTQPRYNLSTREIIW